MISFFESVRIDFLDNFSERRTDRLNQKLYVMLTRRPKITTMLVLLFITLLLPGLSLGQDTSNVTCSASQDCPDNYCCNVLGYCGTTEGFCGVGNCSSQCPTSNAQCGPMHNYSSCPDGSCCAGGYCGVTPAYCGVGLCESQCPPPPSAAPTPGSGLLPLGGESGGKRKLLLGRESGGKSKLSMILVGTSVSVVVLVIVCIVIGLCISKSRSPGQRRWADSTMQSEGVPERFSYKQLSLATGSFSEQSKLGQGGFGSVYGGLLPTSGKPVAVKKIHNDSNQGEKEFMAEVSIISRLRHRNLMQLQGWCRDAAREKYLIVYDLMPNGSLDRALFGPAGSTQTAILTWPQRFSIVTGTAAAVDYLHQGWSQQVIHRDIKSSNIMLDENWNAKLGDFGLARLVDHQRAAGATVVVGTCGYIAPEAAYSGRFTDKSDVFAFGIVVLEIACGRRAVSAEFPPEEVVLLDWVWQRLSEGNLLSTVDKRLHEYDTDGMEVVMLVGLLCSHPDPSARPSMRHVLQVLAGEAPVPSIPTSKPAPVYHSVTGIVSTNYLCTPKFRSTTAKSWGSSKSRSGSISPVPTSTSDAARETECFDRSSNLNPSFPEIISSGDGLAAGPRNGTPLTPYLDGDDVIEKV